MACLQKLTCRIHIFFLKPFNTQDLIKNSPYCLPHNSYNAISENLVLDEPENPQTWIFFILITCLIDIVLIL